MEGRGAGKLSARLVAEHLLWLRRDQETTPLHVVKLVYLCHAWMLGLKQQELVDEPIIAGRYGPVIKSIYDQYVIYGDGPIFGEPAVDHARDLSPMQAAVMSFVHTAYRELPDTTLSEITHEPGTPWSKTRKSEGLGAEITSDLIREHYEQLIREYWPAENAR